MQWIYRAVNTAPAPEQLPIWANRLEISPTLAQLLWRRGFTDLEEMEFFLNPGLRNLAPLAAWPGLEKAAKVLVDGLLAGKKLCVWGDYDVDGITSTALITEFVQGHGFSCTHHIPNRLTEGYGLNTAQLSHLAAEGVDMLLTVDSGISDSAAIAHALELGMTVVISDHHLPAEELPLAHAIVNPRIGLCPCPSLAGVGVAFFLAAAMNVALEAAGKEKTDIRTLLDLVALGTLADVVDVHGQNRILIKNGMLLINKGVRVGIAALKTACNLSPAAALGAGQIVFTLAPRINAAGRLSSSETALELLLTEDRQRAAELANELSRLNAERKDEEDRILQEAEQQAEEFVTAGYMGLVLYSQDWHPGIIGIVASRIVEAFHRPTVVLSYVDGYLKGSGRGVAAINLHDTFTRAADLLLGYGGHSMAAGLSMSMENLKPFRQLFNTLSLEAMGGDVAEGVCKIDADLSFAEADFTFLKELEMLQPFGTGNSEPVFASPPVVIKYMRVRPNFLVLNLEDEESGICFRATAWRDLANMPYEMKGKRIRVAYTPRIDRYNGAASIELRLRDWTKEDE